MHLATRLLALLLLVPTAAAQWTVQAVPTANDFNDVWARSASEAYAVAEGGVLIRTTDGGETWTAQQLAGDLEGIAFNGAGVGIAVNDDGVAYRTTDGLAWAPVATGAGDLRGVAFGTPTTVFAAGRDGGGARSADGGLTWTALSTGAAERTEAVAAAGSRLWAVGRGGEIRFSPDGGLTWSAQASGTAADLESIRMLDEQNGYIGGSNDTVLRTTDGGTTWTAVSNGDAGGGVAFVSEAVGWAVSEAGQIHHTADAGATWQPQPSGTASNLSRVHFADASHGWAVGDFGTVVAFSSTVSADTGRPVGASPGLEVFPSPASRFVHARAAAEAGAVLSVHDVLGRPLLTRELGGGQGTAGIRLDTSAFPPGLYTVRLQAREARVTRRFVVVR